MLHVEQFRVDAAVRDQRHGVARDDPQAVPGLSGGERHAGPAGSRSHGRRDPAVGLEPVFLVRRGQLAHPLAHGVLQPRLPNEGGVGLDEDVVDRPFLVVEEQLDDAEAFVDRLEEGAVAQLRFRDPLAGVGLLGNVAKITDDSV